MRLIRIGDCAAEPWHNGGGETHELWSDATDEIAFARRVSVAQLISPGPFSVLPGIDRSLLVLDPISIALTLDHQSMQLDRGDILVFHGEDAVLLTALSAPGRVLNIMTRRSRFTHALALLSDMPETTPFGMVALDEVDSGKCKIRTGDLVLEPDKRWLSAFPMASIRFDGPPAQ
jgi:environmental stress-induced protein Ves